MDLSRATLNDLVEDFVKLELGYGEKDFVVNNDVGILYDADETENLTRKLTDLGRPTGHHFPVSRADQPQAFNPTASSPLSTRTRTTPLSTLSSTSRSRRSYPHPSPAPLTSL